MSLEIYDNVYENCWREHSSNTQQLQIHIKNPQCLSNMMSCYQQELNLRKALHLLEKMELSLSTRKPSPAALAKTPLRSIR